MISEYFDAAVSRRICMMLLHSIWQFGLLVAIVELASRMRRSSTAKATYALHVSALLLGLMALPVTYTWLDRSEHGRNATMTAARFGDLAAPTAPGSRNLDRSSDPRLDGHWSDIGRGLVPRVVLNTIASRLLPGDAIARWIVSVYLLGVAVMSIRLLMAMGDAERLRFRATLIAHGPLRDTVDSLWRRWSRRQAPRIARTDKVILPKVIGFVRPIILLPMSAIGGLTVAELELVLAHELAHVRRGDPWIHLVQRLAEVILFFNPLVWRLSRRISLLREYCCDDLACRMDTGYGTHSRICFATTLLKVAEQAVSSPRQRQELAALAVGGDSPSELRRRVARLVGERYHESTQFTRGGIMIVAVTVLWMAAIPLLGRAHAQTPENPPSTGDRTEASIRPRDDERNQQSLLRLQRKLPSSNVMDAPLEGANLAHLDLSGVVLDRGLDRLFAEADLRSSDLRDALLAGGTKAFFHTDFSNGRLNHATLTGHAALQRANFDHADLSNAVLQGGAAGLQEASFRGAILIDAQLSGESASFQESTFEKANLTGAHLQGGSSSFQLANFDHANLTDVTIECRGVATFQLATINSTDFSGANLASIAAADLASCRFQRATPPTYTRETQFPPRFNPKRAGWKQVEVKQASE